MVSRRKFIKATGSLAAIVSGLGLAGCTTTTNPTTTSPTTAATTTVLTTTTPIQGGTLKIGVPVMSTNVDTRVGSPTGGPPTWCSCVEPLLGFNEELSGLEPLLATSLTTTDCLTYHIELREGIKFHDGSEFNADDVVAIIEWIAGRLDNGILAPYRSNFGYPNITETRKVDSHTIEFVISKKMAGLEYQYARTYTALMIPEEKLRSTASVTWPIGTGPYKIVAITPGEYVKLQPFADYWGNDDPAFWAGPAYLDTVEVFLYTDEQARLAALETGEIDVAILNDYSSVAVTNSMSNASCRNNIKIFSFAPARFNLRNSPFDDIRFREALCKGVDWPNICNVIWREQERAWDLCVNTPYAYQGNAQGMWPTYDFNTAKILIDQLQAEGKIRTVNLTKVMGRVGEGAAELVKGELQKLGVPSEITIIESAAEATFFRSNLKPPNQWDITLQQIDSICAEDIDFVRIFYSKAGLLSDGTHYSGIVDPLMDSYVETWRTTVDQSVRVQLAKDIQERVASQRWLMPLVINVTRLGIRNNIHNIRPSHTFRVGPLPYTRVWKG